MRTRLPIVASLLLALALGGCCTGGSTAPVVAPVVPAIPGVVPPVGAPGDALAPLAIGGAEVTAAIAPMVTVPFVVGAPGEYQIDAMASGVDAQLYLMQDDNLVTSDSDSGDGVDARIIAFLAPGTYGARVYEYHGGAMSASVGVSLLPPLTPVAALAPGGPPVVVSVPAGGSAREGSVEITLTVAAPGSVRIDVGSPDASLDGELTLIQNGAVLASDSDSGDGNNAQLTQVVSPGSYTIRVRDWINRAGSLTVTVVPL